MNEDLTPKELARIKREARAKRISNIRRRVLVLGATLAAVFSGLVLARTEFNLNPAGASPKTALVQQVPTSNDEEGDHEDEEGFDSEDLGGAIVSVVASVLSDSGEGSSAASSTSSTTSQPSAPLTTSQS